MQQSWISFCTAKAREMWPFNPALVGLEILTKSRLKFILAYFSILSDQLTTLVGPGKGIGPL